jgi:hypothetical protein
MLMLMLCGTCGLHAQEGEGPQKAQKKVMENIFA